jgi:hypothetical protein
MSRLGTELLRKGGFGPWSSGLLSAGLCLSAFLFVEVNDGYYTEFSPGDMTANVLGAALATAMSAWPAWDAAFDLRVQWFPSLAYRRHPSPDVAEDYSGQTYLLAYKPRSIAAVRESHGSLWLLQFVNPVIGFETRNYRPVPQVPETPRRQRSRSSPPSPRRFACWARPSMPWRRKFTHAPPSSRAAGSRRNARWMTTSRCSASWRMS